MGTRNTWKVWQDIGDVSFLEIVCKVEENGQQRNLEVNR